MIFVRRDANVIPPALLAAALAAQRQLETLPANQRREFIKSKSSVWRDFSEVLAKMSFGKCWYSESPDPQSFFDVDHFRPKNEAKRTSIETDPGYEWLAFSWENFRYAANCSNRLSTNDDTGVVEGKGSWFPLLPSGNKACWDDRCTGDEHPLLIDPVEKDDVALIDVSDDGRIITSAFAVGTARTRVTKSCEFYGLNLPRLKEARLRVIREATDTLNSLLMTISACALPDTTDSIADALPVEELRKQLENKTKPDSPYARTVRAYLSRQGLGSLCKCTEERP